MSQLEKLKALQESKSKTANLSLFNNLVVIDVGINELDGKTVGDVDYDAVKDIASAITPVPGGVGSVTTTMMLEAVYEAYHA